MKVVEHHVANLEHAMVYLWELWCAQNCFMFQYVPFNFYAIVQKFLSQSAIGEQSDPHRRVRFICYPKHSIDEIVGFFDGVALDGDCGAGMVVKLAGNYTVHLCMAVDKGHKSSC